MLIQAGYEGRCPGCEGPVWEGETTGLVGGLWCCEECVRELGEDPDLDLPDLELELEERAA